MAQGELVSAHDQVGPALEAARHLGVGVGELGGELVLGGSDGSALLVDLVVGEVGFGLGVDIEGDHESQLVVGGLHLLAQLVRRAFVLAVAWRGGRFLRLAELIVSPLGWRLGCARAGGDHQRHHPGEGR